jgi:DNA-binding transcriptional ArsR family regulator
MTKRSFFTRTAKLFNLLGKPIRLRILMAIGRGEACVCHLESVLKTRQAYISQQLMALREAGLLETRREGKYIFYRLSDPGLLELVAEAAKIMGIAPEDMPSSGQPSKVPGCCCPHCEKETITIPMSEIN